MIEKIPFLHRDRMYNIIVDEDLSFTELHYILDRLIEKSAFESDPDTELYYITYEDTHYTIGVDGMDVMIVIK